MTGIRYSGALRKLYGYQDETEFPDVWESWMNCILPEDRAYVENSYLAAVKDHTGNTTYDVTYRCRRKDGVVRWQRAAGYVMRRANGSPITCYGLVMDVDVQKKAADKIEQALTQAQIASAAKTSFLARMSHDIRTPMNGILGLIEINEKHADEQEFTARNRKKAKVAANYLLAHLFEPFAREHTENTAYEGTGLGMAIVKQLIEKMGGTIEVQSQEGIGSHFTIELPFAIAQKQDVVNPESEGMQDDISGVRILLVEDNDLNMEIAETFLKDAGARVTKAFNGQQAVYLFDKSEPEQFDVILMDVMMPVMNGYEATRNIRALNRPDAKTIPIIAMTANAFVEDIQESKEAGMNEHISKPLDIAKVIAMIGKYRKNAEKQG